MYVGGVWGDAIYLWPDEPEKEGKTSIYGFKDPWRNGFAEGSVLFDLVHYKYEDSIPLYYVSNIKYKDDPRDMFTADISFIGMVKNPKPDGLNYDMCWYKDGLNPIIEDYEKQYKAIPFFSFRKRRKVKTFINTLREMMDIK